MLLFIFFYHFFELYVEICQDFLFINLAPSHLAAGEFPYMFLIGIFFAHIVSFNLYINFFQSHLALDKVLTRRNFLDYVPFFGTFLQL